FMNQHVDIAERAHAQDSVQTRNEVGALEQDAVDPFIVHVALNRREPVEFDPVPGADADIVSDVSLDIRRPHSSRSGARRCRSNRRSRIFQQRSTEPATRNLPDRYAPNSAEAGSPRTGARLSRSASSPALTPPRSTVNATSKPASWTTALTRASCAPQG